MPQESQLRKAREALDLFGPVARHLNMAAAGAELEALAFAALHRARPMRPACHRTIIALDIEGSTSRPDPVKAELRTMLYELFDAALRSAGIYPRHRPSRADSPRGSGSESACPKSRHPGIQPASGRLRCQPPAACSQQREVRVRVVLHAGEVHYDSDGCYGEALDIACRLLDAPIVKKALKAAPGPLILVVSGDIYRTVVRHGYDQIAHGNFHRLVGKRIAGRHYAGWIRQDSPE